MSIESASELLEEYYQRIADFGATPHQIPWYWLFRTPDIGDVVHLKFKQHESQNLIGFNRFVNSSLLIDHNSKNRPNRRCIPAHAESIIRNTYDETETRLVQKHKFKYIHQSATKAVELTGQKVYKIDWIQEKIPKEMTYAKPNYNNGYFLCTGLTILTKASYKRERKEYSSKINYSIESVDNKKKGKCLFVTLRPINAQTNVVGEEFDFNTKVEVMHIWLSTLLFDFAVKIAPTMFEAISQQNTSQNLLLLIKAWEKMIDTNKEYVIELIRADVNVIEKLPKKWQQNYEVLFLSGINGNDAMNLWLVDKFIKSLVNPS